MGLESGKELKGHLEPQHEAVSDWRLESGKELKVLNLSNPDPVTSSLESGKELKVPVAHWSPEVEKQRVWNPERN